MLRIKRRITQINADFYIGQYSAAELFSVIKRNSAIKNPYLAENIICQPPLHKPPKAYKHDKCCNSIIQ